MNAGGILGRIVPACLSDAVGRFNLLTPSAFLSGLLCIVLWLPLAVIADRSATAAGVEGGRAWVGALVFAVFYGFSSGAFVALMTPCVAQISEVKKVGTRIGVLYSVISFP